MVSEEFQDYNFMINSFAALHEMKCKGEFCDITIKFESRTISAHRNVIVAGIPYFRDKLTNENSETDLNDGFTELNLNADALECLIEFCYTSKVKLTTENVKVILPAATFLGIDSVIDACCRFIVKRLKAEEVLNMRQYAEGISSSKLLESIDAYVCEHFDDVSKSEIFLDAPFLYVKELIGSEDLEPSKEEIVLDFVLKWVKKSPGERGVNLEELLSKVRMSLIQPDYLTDFLKEDLIVHSISCRNILEDARTFHFLPHRRAMISSFESSVRGHVKKSAKSNKGWAPGIYAVCSLPEENYSKPRLPAQSLWYYDPLNGEWSIVDVFCSTLHSVSCYLIQWNGKLYFYDSDYIRAYDPLSSSASSNSSFYIGQRFNAGVTVSEDRLYICGGTAANEFLPSNTIICFDFLNSRRTMIQYIPFRRTHIGTVSLNGYLYVLGGNNELGQCLSSVQKYGLRSGLWTETTPMQHSRCSMGCAVLNGKIYVCGGAFTYSVMQTAEVFDPLTNKWVGLSQMRNPLFDFSLIPYDGKLYAVGGRNRISEDKSTAVSYMYDPKTAKWDYKGSLGSCMKFLKATSVEQMTT